MTESNDARSALPKKALFDGARTLFRVLEPHGFRFEFRGEGESSGGLFAWGEFVRAERRLEVHVRHNLGLVTYHVADRSASHDYYMRELGVVEQCHYPGFSPDPADAFEGLAHDLTFAEDFLFGTADVLRSAAAREATDIEKRHYRLNVESAGDIRRIESMKAQFHAGQYSQVLATVSQVQHPEILTQSELRMIQIARDRTERDRLTR
ncbi:MAG: hypothetical protein ACLQG3_08670 [Terracidiphilus sp.]